MSENNCLFITKHNPFGCGGGAFASYAYLKLFLHIFDNVDLCMAKECVVINPLIREEHIISVDKRSLLKKLLQIPLGIYHRYYDKIKTIDKSVYRYAVLDHSAVSSTFVKNFNKNNVYTITIHHNVEKEYFLSNSSSFFKRIAAFYIEKNERKAYKNSKLNLFLTEYDKKYFENHYGTSKGYNFVSSYFFDSDTFFYNNSLVSKKYDFVISCSLSSFQNINMIISFLKEYRKVLEQYTLLITGSNPSPELIEFLSNYKNIVLVKNPVNINEVIAEAKIYLCPITDGGGIKVRCFDAIAQLMPAVLHKNALRGYEILKEKGFFFEYDSIDSFENTIRNVIDSYNTFESSKKLYKEIACEYYSENSLREKLNKFLFEQE